MPVRKVKKKGKKYVKNPKKIKIPFPSDTQKRMANNVHYDGRRKKISPDLEFLLQNSFKNLMI